MIHYLRLALLAAAFGLFSGGAQAANSAAAASDAWDKAYNAGDASALAALYDADAVSMGPGAPALEGRDAIAADFRTFFAANKGRHHTLAPVREGAGDIVVERGRYESVTTPKNGARPTREHGKHIVVWHKGRDGRWRVKWEIWNTD